MITAPHWLGDVFFWLALVNLVAVLVCLGLLILGRSLVRRLIDVPAEPVAWPSVSLIAPARNEEPNVERAVRSLARLDYPNLEITIINDRSTDRTGEILDRLAEACRQLIVVPLPELP